MKQFFITFFANLAALLVVFGAPLLLLIILSIASYGSSSRQQRLVSLERDSILVMDMSVNVADSPEHASNDNPLASVLSNDDSRTVVLRHWTRSLQYAAKDDRIKALFIQGSFQPGDFGSGFAALKELRQAIVEFKHSGKKVYAYLEAPTTRDYYVASAASTIYLNPYGEMEIPGMAAVKTYFTGALQKYGVDVQVTRVGRYKSAVEPFILTKMSDADREETEKLLNDIWSEFLTSTTQSRKIDTATFQQLVDTEGYILPESALSAKLVDKLAYFGDVLNDLGKVAPPGAYEADRIPFKQVSINNYYKVGRKPKLPGDQRTDSQVAILYLEGEIVDGTGDLTNIGGDRFAAEIRSLRKDKDVKAVVLRVNSPGGSAFASEVIQNEIVALKKANKPVIVSMGSYAASGGYWISAPGDRIFAEPNTLTGSIGVFGLFMNIQKLGNSFGVTWDTAKVGNYADFETISRPKTEQELALAQARVDDLYKKFLGKVADNRGIKMETLEGIAQGRVWAGSEALDLHLVDEIGGLDKAVTYAASKANLGSNYKITEFPRRVTFAEALSILFSGDDQETPVTRAKAKKADPLTLEFFRAKAELKSLQNLNDPLGFYARLPLGFDIR